MASTYVIADIHAHLVPLAAILAAINPQRDDTLITLGDYIDRGPDTRGVLDALIRVREKTRLIPLMGNHEEMMLLTWENATEKGRPEIVANWLLNGGTEALESYDSSSAEAGFEAIPQAHWDFLRSCGNYHQTETHIFVHAGVNPYLPMEQQDATTLRWQRFDDPPPHISGRIVVCGHTPQRSGFPRNIGHAVCLDTGIHVGRYLTCLKLPENLILQADPKGQIRTSPLSAHLVAPGR